jgi:hypothetical protein
VRLDGEWEGNAVSRVRGIFHNTEFVSKINISMIFSYKKGEANVSSIVIFDFTDFLTDLANIEEKKRIYKRKYMGIYKSVLQDIFDFIIFDRYSLFWRSTELAVEFFASDSDGDFLINKDEDMLFLKYFKPSFILGIGDSGFTEMIFRKIYKVI